MKLKMSVKVLVAVTDYPSNENSVVHRFVHTRNLYYIQAGVEVVVLNFATLENYIFEGIRVISLKGYVNERVSSKYDVLILHQANLRNHFRFINRYGNDFPRFVFFYHGHEVLKLNCVYPKPYEYKKQRIIRRLIQNWYDDYKLKKWHDYLPTIAYKSFFVFVSQWMMEEFIRWVKLDSGFLNNRSEIIYNCVGKTFEIEQYECLSEKKYDFVTIRGNIDTSKYAIDIVNRMAENTPRGRFLIVGKGDYFKYNNKAKNITWLDRTLDHAEIVVALNQARFALMPTRTDAQGLMMCEMAAFGIPVITSDIPVCHEIFDGFENAYFIKNNEGLSLDEFIDKKSSVIKDDRYYENKTVEREVRIIKHQID